MGVGTTTTTDPVRIFHAEFVAANDLVILTAAALKDAVSDSVTKRERATKAREYFAAWEALIDMYRSKRNWTDDGRPINIIPPNTMWMIQGLCGHLAVGDTRGPIEDAAGPGQKKLGPMARNDIRIAGVYVAAAKAGKIADSSPVKTVAKSYVVNMRTAQGWVRSTPALQAAVQNANDEYFEALPEMLARASKDYLHAGPSREAVKKRASKRS